MLTFKHEHEFIFAFPTIKFLDWIFIIILQEYRNSVKLIFNAF